MINVISEIVKKIDGHFGDYYEKIVERDVEFSGVRYKVEYVKTEYSNNLMNDLVIQIKINDIRMLYFTYYFEEYDQAVEPEYYITDKFTKEQLEELCGEDLKIIDSIITPF